MHLNLISGFLARESDLRQCISLIEGDGRDLTFLNTYKVLFCTSGTVFFLISYWRKQSESKSHTISTGSRDLKEKLQNAKFANFHYIKYLSKSSLIMTPNLLSKASREQINSVAAQKVRDILKWDWSVTISDCK